MEGLTSAMKSRVRKPMIPQIVPKTDIQRLISAVRQRAQDYFPEIQEATEIRITDTNHRPHSDIYNVTLAAERISPRQVIIKVFRGAEVQFHGMTAVWPHFAEHPTLKIPRPLDYLEAASALVMEAVPGASLQARLPRLAWGGRSLLAAEEDCRRAGTWLRYYHDLGRTDETAPLDVASKWDGLNETLAELVEAGLDRGLSRQIAEAVQPLVNRVARKPRPVSHVHGEFTADNLLLDAHRVTALDLWGEHRSAIDHDIASFLNSLFLLRLTRPSPWRALGRLRDAFLDGYFGGEPRDDAAITFLQGIGLCDTAVEILRRRPTALARWWVRHVLIGAMKTVSAGSGGVR